MSIFFLPDGRTLSYAIYGVHLGVRKADECVSKMEEVLDKREGL
jgi:hypothetical protein